LEKVVRLAVGFLDSVIEVNPFPIEEIRKTVRAIRRIGLGVGGWADLLVELGVAYDSDEAIKLAEGVMSFIEKSAVEETKKLAKQRGAFPLWDQSIYRNGDRRRNSTVTTIAPTGTTSIIAGASSGIEPLFAIAYQHKVKDESLDRTLTFINPKFEEAVKGESLWSDELREKVAEHGTVRDIVELPKHIKDAFGTAHEIHHNWHIKMQSVFQKYTDNAVSKTINMQNSATPNEIKQAYLLAWETGCKGATVFRDGCKDAQVLNLGIKDEKGEEITPRVWTRPMKVSGSTYKINTPVGTAFITVNHDELRNPIEVFINIGKAGSDVQAMAEALGRVISKSLKFGTELNPKEKAVAIIDQLRGIGGRRSIGFGPNKILSLPDAVAVALSTHFGVRVNGIGVYETQESESQEQGDDLQANGEQINGDWMASEGDGGKAVDKVEGSDVVGVVGESQIAESVSVGSASFESSYVQSKPSGDICPTCGASSMFYQEGCVKCLSCGHSEC
jgi:ribonucleoside-diphosphate reductase alpha chain